MTGQLIHQRNKGRSTIVCYCVFILLLITLLGLDQTLATFNSLAFHFSLFFTGFFVWTFFEYMFHRYWMHHVSKSNGKKDFNHVYHHSHPTDIRISAFQRFLLAVSALGIIFISIWLQNYFTVAAGFLCGFPMYTIMHFLLHQKSTQKIFKKLIQYHIYHHCKSPDKCFGVSVTWWDSILRTMPKKGDILSQRIIDFYFRHENQHRKNL